MPPFAAGLLVFGASAAILVLEILAGRLLAPYVGVTLETYSGIIGTVLAGISLGTFLGGRLADRVDPRRTLGPLLVAGGALSVCVLPAVRIAGSLQLGGGTMAVVTLAFVGFFAPAAVLSAVSPTVVKLQLHDLDQTGGVVGRLSALSTAGAIFGTFLTGFVLLSAVPTQPLVLSVGAALVIVGLACWAALGRRGPLPASALALALVGAGGGIALPAPCQVESAYFCARVEVDQQRPTGRTLYLDTLRHSYVDLADPQHLEFTYAQTMSDVIATLPEGPLDVLHVGGGGFTMPRFVAAVRPGSASRVLELDPAVFALAKAELGLRTSDDLQVRIGDARTGLRGEPEGAYDLVIGDAFGGLAVPWHLTTKEFVQQIHDRLRPGGVYVVNLIDYPPLGFARAEAATLDAVFEHAAVLAPQVRLDRVDGGNIILVASDAPIPLDAVLARNAQRGDDEAARTAAEFADGAQVLTDDFAPVDQLLTPLT